MIAENIRTSAHITGHIENDTLIIEHYRINSIIDKLKTHLYDFFEGNKEFSDFLNYIKYIITSFSFTLLFNTK